MRRKSAAIVVFTLAVFLGACGQGPQGPKGEQGPPGPQERSTIRPFLAKW
jgi:hypothetical protein